jgi:hypothetical protein
MKGDIAFAGFVLTADEWQALDPDARAQLLAVATSSDLWVASPVPEAFVDVPAGGLAEGSGPLERDDYEDIGLDLNEA